MKNINDDKIKTRTPPPQRHKYKKAIHSQSEFKRIKAKGAVL